MATHKHQWPFNAQTSSNAKTAAPCCSSAPPNVVLVLFSRTELNNYPVLPVCALEMFFFLWKQYSSQIKFSVTVRQQGSTLRFVLACDATSS